MDGELEQNTMEGRISLEDFTPYPKNSIIAKFFMNIGYIDSLQKEGLSTKIGNFLRKILNIQKLI